MVLRTIKRILVTTLAMAIVIASVNYVPSKKVKAATFEQSIASFPKSYKPYLRKLHKKYPKWKFIPYKTNIKFASAVAKEGSGDRSLIENSNSKFWKSNKKGDYIASSKRYIAKDGGVWVTASKNSVAYFMDPRNFLNSTFIYMFESLSYDQKTHTKSGVEAVLKNTFMYKTNICYINRKGKYKKTKTKYSSQIVSAAKASNVNAFYIASKIRQEIGGGRNAKYKGMGASGSVSGRYGSYTGIYNFYNIGAFTGPNPISSGLSWASSGKGYNRPWTTPMRSITGGAKYIGSKYINCGQHTIYFERFNVNRSSRYGLYEHQYMTNVYGAAAEAMLTANAYNSMGIAKQTKKFIIPIFKKMPSRRQFVRMGKRAKSGRTTTSVTLRKGPGTSYRGITSLSKKTAVTVYKGVISNVGYGIGLLKNPYWYYVHVRKSGRVYKGYVTASYVTTNVEKYISKGVKTKLPISISKSGKVYYRSNNPAVCKVDKNGYVTGKKKGSVTIFAISSTGSLSPIKVEICSSGVKVTPIYMQLYTTQKRKIKAKLFPSKKKNKVKKYVSSNKKVASVTKKGLVKAKKPGIAYIKCIPEKGFRSTCKVNVLNATPNQPIGHVRSLGYNSAHVGWSRQNGISGYHIYRKDGAKRIAFLKTVKGTITSFTDSGLTAGVTYAYSIVPYRYVDRKMFKGKGSKGVRVVPRPNRPVMKKIKPKKNGAVVKWKSVYGANGYALYRSKKKKTGYKKIVEIKAGSKLKYYDKKLKKKKKYYYKALAYTRVNNKNVLSWFSKIRTFKRKK